MNDVARAVQALRAGELVAFPTETVYGLGADAANADAVRRLYAVKRRPVDHPVIVHLARAEELDELAREVPDAARLLAKSFWPGPLTIIVRRDPERIVPAVTGGRDTVGLRMPDHPLARRLLESFGGGVAAPSANRFGRVSPTTAAHVRADLGDDVRVVLDGGACRIGLESTIVDVTGREPAILRVGGVEPRGDRARARVRLRVAHVGRSCGIRHAGIALRAARRSGGRRCRRGGRTGACPHRRGRRTGLLALRGVLPEPVEELILLDAPRDIEDYARVLYTRLRAADEQELDVLLVVSPPASDGLGAAVADRVRRAAH